jgi:predicted lysophospholipase L1 biosynthesis ABC-type transport system permease subunit
VSAGYFETLRIPLRRGRNFSPADHLNGPKVALVSETAARQLWPGEDPIGKPMALGMNGFGQVEVVGIVGDVRYGAVESAPRADVYVSYRQSPGGGVAFLRTSGDPAALAGSVRAAVREVDPNVAVHEIKTMAERARSALLMARFSTSVLGVFAGIALLLSAVGIYGLLSYLVSERRQEIGIRMAIGAAAGDILVQFLVEAVVLSCVGGVIGVVLGVAAAGAISVLAGWPTLISGFAIVGALLFSATVGVFFGFWPARRAAGLDPIAALRYE